MLPCIAGHVGADAAAVALSEQPGQSDDLVLIHDAARPLIDAPTITAVHKALAQHPGAIAAKPLVDTLKRGNHAVIETTIDRSNLWQAHTPQAFHFDAILKAHQQCAGAQLTDDAAVAEHVGLPVTLVPSNPDNMKITNPDDLGRAERLLGQNHGDIRTGLGFDVHRLIPGDKIWLGGLAIPHHQTAEAHSDGDVVLHAVVDAILGTMAAGDIGTHFPPSDPQWKNADSAQFVRHAVRLVNERGGLIAHVDIVLMCEAPRVGPHREGRAEYRIAGGERHQRRHREHGNHRAIGDGLGVADHLAEEAAQIVIAAHP
ncbi:MAG: 2-C-methyl-D-erythritol 2,4-cyclodiphosphate synthase, partial [Rhodobacteraceae bacterium]|nr:2-C-methyl-D-erythritol 2,4-cyclodiphosphate synthase [Paracoccaceae bacterium]